ncbi:MAG TPA: MmgE/PrpD family protein [Kiloniellales bacterium]|nr:MmgE/PrpD family protein [Kiloniellales bacterium]
MNYSASGPAVAERFADWAAGLEAARLPAPLTDKLECLVLENIGLCVAARRRDYVAAVLASCEADGACTAIGQGRALDSYGAALVNGIAAHGEDYDDTFEGTPVHVGAVLVPALLAACQSRNLDGRALLRGLAVGAELSCRLALVAPTAMHRAGFHPTAVIGALGATAGVGAALGLDARKLASALGTAGSFASGIIEYLSEGTWPKRIHAGWAAQSGIRAAYLGERGFLGPRTVLEGPHGYFFAFAEPSIPRDYDQVTNELGETWWAETLAFKPYACGTMCQPFIDCALRLKAAGVDPARIREIHCTVGEGTVHRLWEPRAEKTAPSSAFSAKFSTPYGIAIAFVDGKAGLEQFTDARVSDPAVRGLAAKVTYEIDPNDEYPHNYSGYLRVTLDDGKVVEERQPHLRGGKREPLSRDEIVAKMRANLVYGGWPESRAGEVESFCTGIFERRDLSGLAAFAE